jgi:hypothetical protein
VGDSRFEAFSSKEKKTFASPKFATNIFCCNHGAAAKQPSHALLTLD